MSWLLQQSRAELSLPPWRAQIDLAQPRTGLTNIGGAGRMPATEHLLAIELDASSTTLDDCYVRVGDLVATYPQTESRPMRVQVYWRVDPSTAPSLPWMAVDVQISVQTSLLGIPTPLSTFSRVAASEVWRLVDADRGAFQALEPPSLGAARDSIQISPTEGPSCLLFRQAGADWSYAEMIHRADFQRDELTASSGPPASGDLPGAWLGYRHHLFPESLEKGVIIRSRLRGAFLPRQDDQRHLAECYAAFLDAPPPLTT